MLEGGLRTSRPVEQRRGAIEGRSRTRQARDVSRLELWRLTLVAAFGQVLGGSDVERLRRAAKAPLIDDFLGYLYSPLERATKVMRAPRAGFRLPKPNHILLPEGYVAEVVATGFHEPVHCTFHD